MVLVVLGGLLFVRTVMPDLWLQLMEELPQRLDRVSQADPVAEQPQAETPLKSSPLAHPGAGLPPKLPAQRPGAGERTDGQAGETETDKPGPSSAATSGESPDLVAPAGSAAPSDATPGSLSLLEDLGTASERSSRETLPGAEAAGFGDASPVVTSAVPQLLGGNEPPDAAKTPTAWHAFWKPFRTEHSATGFASHIRQATGLPIEVRRNPRGEYVVGFSYRDQMELEGNLALIEAGTGLRVLGEAYP